MKTAIKVNTVGKTPFIDWGASVSEDERLLQNVMMTLGCSVGSDQVFKRRGTDLRKEMSSAKLLNNSDVQHALNFASLSVRDFLVGGGFEPDLRKIRIRVQNFDGRRIKAETRITKVDTTGPVEALDVNLNL